MITKVSVTGIQEVIASIEGGMQLQAKKTCEKTLRAIAQRIFKRSQKLVPVDTGRLKASGHVEESGTGFDILMAISYDTPYALYVHEIPDPPTSHATPTQWKYLERAVQEEYNKGPIFARAE